MKASNFYSGTEINRVSDKRRNQNWIEQCLKSAHSVLVPIWRGKNLITSLEEHPKPYLVPITNTALESCVDPIFLGIRHGQTYFAADLSHHKEPPFVDLGSYRDLREIGPLLHREFAAVLAYARAMTTWQARHKFCGQCGGRTVSQEAGHVLTCMNKECGFLCFPRTDPAVIMLIHDGGDCCILGRQKIWRSGQHSVLAGFVEPGESLEDAVVREVYEEVGLQISDVEYHSSQPWPFPSSIMLGFYGRAIKATLKVNTFELESARWFDRGEISSCPQDDYFRLPRTDSIARRLIEDWLKEG